MALNVILCVYTRKNNSSVNVMSDMDEGKPTTPGVEEVAASIEELMLQDECVLIDDRIVVGELGRILIFNAM